MTTSDHQWAFLKDLARLIQFAEAKGYKLTGSWLYRDPSTNARIGGSRNSNHKKKLAIDLNLFIEDDYQTSTAAHAPLGEFWESLDPLNRWGGRFKDGRYIPGITDGFDGNHYERHV